jgi:hypothetical protein
MEDVTKNMMLAEHNYCGMWIRLNDFSKPA